MNRSQTYEGMFLVHSGRDFQTASQPIVKVLERSEAQVLSIRPWEERRLAYQIKGQKRGLYVLTYFKADPQRIAELERDCRLNEDILRVLILRRDRLTDEQIAAETPATARAKQAPPAPDEPVPPAETPAKQAPTDQETPAPADADAEAPAPDKPDDAEPPARDKTDDSDTAKGRNKSDDETQDDETQRDAEAQ